MVLLSNQGKTNSTGRLDRQGAFRHRLPELCCIGGLGFYLFSRFHILGTGPPDFTPDFDDSRGGERGFRAWYELFLFPGANGDASEMTYESR